MAKFNEGACRTRGLTLVYPKLGSVTIREYTEAEGDGMTLVPKDDQVYATVEPVGFCRRCASAVSRRTMKLSRARQEGELRWMQWDLCDGHFRHAMVSDSQVFDSGHAFGGWVAV